METTRFEDWLIMNESRLREEYSKIENWYDFVRRKYVEETGEKLK